MAREEEAMRKWIEVHSAREPDTHWAPGFVPFNEIEAFMGRRVDPVEEATIRVRLARDLELEGH